MADDTREKPVTGSGTLIRAQNGDVLRYDSTGLVMVLSDRVISDISRRLPAKESVADTRQWIDPMILGDIDAWDVRREGEWLMFSANLDGAQGARQFRRLEKPDSDELEPGIFADGAGPLRGLFSLGGARRALGFDTPLTYPWHVLSPADDLGAVGHAGETTAQTLSALEPVRDVTRDAALADVLLSEQHGNHRAMTLFVTRVETDCSGCVHELAKGIAYQNLMTGIASLQAAAKRLGRPATLHSIGLEFTLEDVVSDAKTYRNGVFDLLAQLTSDIARLGLSRPPVLTVFDCGTHTLADHPILRAQWELAWQGADHGLTYVAPGYMFKQDRYGRPDQTALHQMAEMDAHALRVLHEGQAWSCPIFLLAEREADPAQIRVRAQAMQDLEIDNDALFGAGGSCGFSLNGASNQPKLIGVRVAPDDPRDLILSFDIAPEGASLELLYAFGMMPARSGLDYPMACGSIRDSWSAKSSTGTTLHRWALPAALPVW